MLCYEFPSYYQMLTVVMEIVYLDVQHAQTNTELRFLQMCALFQYATLLYLFTAKNNDLLKIPPCIFEDTLVASTFTSLRFLLFFFPARQTKTSSNSFVNYLLMACYMLFQTNFF